MHRGLRRFIDDAQWQWQLSLDDLMGTVQALPVDAAAQDIVTRQGRLPGLAEAFQVQAADSQAQLVDVSAALGFIQRVEEHALLHGRQWVEVFDVVAGHRQCIQLRLSDARQREVRR